MRLKARLAAGKPGSVPPQALSACKRPNPLTQTMNRTPTLPRPNANPISKGAFSGAGVVICGGGAVYFSSALMVARTLRALGCYLPVEIWVAKGEALPAAVEAGLAQEGIFVCDAGNITTQLATNKEVDERFYMLKPIAIAYSRFRCML